MSAVIVRAAALTPESFAPFGDVIEIAGHAARPINQGTCLRYDDLAPIDVAADGGRPLISIFEAAPRPLPLAVRVLERHPLARQAFFPLDARPFLVVVAAHGSQPLVHRIRAYLSSGAQGVNYRRGTWHHPLIALGETSRFLVVDRGGPGENCDEIAVDEAVFVEVD